MANVSRDPKQWRVTVLPRAKRQGAARAMGLCGGHPVGVADGARWHAHWWPAGEAVPITYPGQPRLQVGSGCDDLIAGGWRTAQGRPGGAVGLRLVKGTLVPVALHPARGWAWTFALGAGGGCVVGHGAPTVAKGAKSIEAALCWDRKAKLVVLPSVRPDMEAVANATDGAWVGGSVGLVRPRQAALWPADGSQVIVLGDPKHVSAVAGVGDGEQVGVWMAGVRVGAALWRGSAASFVDLTPPGHASADAAACRGGLQVGTVRRQDRTRSGDSLETRAALWSGSAASWFDLHSLIPEPWNASTAVGVELRDGGVRIVGDVAQIAIDGRAHAIAARQVAVWETALA